MEKGKTERGKSEGGGFRDRFCNYICQSTPSHSDRQRSRFPSLPCCHQIKRKTENKVEDGGLGGGGGAYVCLFVQPHDTHFSADQHVSMV